MSSASPITMLAGLRSTRRGLLRPCLLPLLLLAIASAGRAPTSSVAGRAPTSSVAAPLPPSQRTPPCVAHDQVAKAPAGTVECTPASATDTGVVPGGFQDTIVLSGLSNPTVVQFADDGHVFVAEKSGLIKVFDDLADPTPTIFADLRTNVHNFWDRGLLGLALDPGYPLEPYVYVLYSFDAAIGGTAPRWGTPGASSDPCPTPPGSTGDGCVIGGRLSRLEAAADVMVGTEQVLIEDWCQQYPSHSIGALAFGADGALYLTGGDGASFNFTDYGQDGSPINPCGDPPGGVGAVLSPPTAEGGALRSQDLRTSADPAGLNGTVLRVNPRTGLALPGNPAYGSADPNVARIIATGLRNPFRLAVRPGSNEVWVSDVGWSTWEEIVRLTTPFGSAPRNFGWPCYEGAFRQGGYNGATLTICETLYTQLAMVTDPYFAYHHSSKVVANETCPAGSSAVTGLAFYTDGNYPAAYHDALFFADYSRDCIWAMRQGADGDPDPAALETFVASAANPVDLKIGPNGDLFYVDFDGGTIHRIQYFDVNQPPVARILASPTNGPAPLAVSFSAISSSDPNPGDTLTYAWDLDGDGQYDDAARARPTYTFNEPGNHIVKLRVTDNHGASGDDVIVIAANNTPPSAVIDLPSASTSWTVDQLIAFSGSANDPQDGPLTPAALSWSLILHHCPANCHSHPLQEFPGVAGGSFNAPGHEYPSHLELRLTATDAGGLQDTESLLLYPQTVDLTLESVPAGAQLSLNGGSEVVPLTRTVILGSNNSISAPSPQVLRGSRYDFLSWSDGGAQSHNVVAVAGMAPIIATYADQTAPVITSVSSGTPQRTSARIIWTTNELATSQVEYGVTPAYGSVTPLDARLRLGHSGALTGLAPSTTYHYRVTSTDVANNVARSGDATFTTPAAGAPHPILINFQPADVPLPVGYLADSGAPYGARGNGYRYGWTGPTPTTVDRNSTHSPDQRYDTLAQVQQSERALWEIEVPNGAYLVRVVAGDARQTTSRYRIAVEGVLTVTGIPSSTRRWIEGTRGVTVSDGRLTITNASEAQHTTICFIEITIVP